MRACHPSSKNNSVHYLNSPESPCPEQTLQEALLNNLEDCKKNGKHREWYEEILKKLIDQYYTASEIDIVIKCLQENPAEDYSDIDYIRLVRKTFRDGSLEQIGRLFSMVKTLINRKLVADRNDSDVQAILSWDNTDFSDVAANKRSDKMEFYATAVTLLSEALILTGDTKNAPSVLYIWEKKLLQQPNLEAVQKCIQSGFFVQEKADTYLDYIVNNGAKNLTPLFVSMKYKK